MTVVDMRSTIKGVVYEQFDYTVAFIQMRYATLMSFFQIDHDVQRHLDPMRRAEIRDFIINSLEKNMPFYFSSFVFAARSGIEIKGNEIILQPGSELYVLDGQHRYSSITSAMSKLQNQAEVAEELGNHQESEKLRQYIEELQNYPVALQIYTNITIQHEKQIFSDYNSERKEAKNGVSLQYDQRDAYSLLTMTTAEKLKDKMEIELEAARLSAKSSAVTTLVVMKRCFIALFEGILTQKTGDPYYRNCKPKDVPKVAEEFFAELYKIFPKEMHNRQQYVVGLTGVQIALAYFIFMTVREQRISHLEAIRTIKHLKKHCTFRHDDPLFAHLYDSKTKQLKNHSSSTAIKKMMSQFLDIMHKEREGV